ncbi:MAG: hypothetical protein H7Z41_20355, partial [Cytophagales bacterium]|nr:hypothetical protein [Armatimonadota bacterium]
MDLMPLGYFGTQEIFVGVWGILSLATTAFWIVMLVDAVRREFSDSNMKLIW